MDFDGKVDFEEILEVLKGRFLILNSGGKEVSEEKWRKSEKSHDFDVSEK